MAVAKDESGHFNIFVLAIWNVFGFDLVKRVVFGKKQDFFENDCELGQGASFIKADNIQVSSSLNLFGFKAIDSVEHEPLSGTSNLEICKNGESGWNCPG